MKQPDSCLNSSWGVTKLRRASGPFLEAAAHGPDAHDVGGDRAQAQQGEGADSRRGPSGATVGTGTALLNSSSVRRLTLAVADLVLLDRAFPVGRLDELDRGLGGGDRGRRAPPGRRPRRLPISEGWQRGRFSSTSVTTWTRPSRGRPPSMEGCSMASSRPRPEPGASLMVESARVQLAGGAVPVGVAGDVPGHRLLGGRSVEPDGDAKHDRRLAEVVGEARVGEPGIDVRRVGVAGVAVELLVDLQHQGVVAVGEARPAWSRRRCKPARRRGSRRRPCPGR